MLYLLRFLFLSEFKPTNVLDGGTFSWDVFLSNLYPINRFKVAKFHAQISISWKNKNIGSMFIAWKVSKPFRDRKSRFIVLPDGFSVITREPLKVCRQVKHCKKGFREILQMGLTEMYVCIWNFWWKPLFYFVSCLFGKVLDDFHINFHPKVLAFLQ